MSTDDGTLPAVPCPHFTSHSRGKISGNQLILNQGTLYPALLELEQTGWVASKWGVSDSGRRVKIYALTRAGRRQLRAEEAAWEHGGGIAARFLKMSEPA